MCEHGQNTTPNHLQNSLKSQLSRRNFFRGMAAVSGTVLWASAGAPGASAQEASGGSGGGFHVGRGLADMTGEPWGAGMFGYAVDEQKTVGIQRRQYARAFIFVDANRDNSRLVHVTCDVGLMFQSIHLEVLRRLKEKFGDLYNQSNVLLTATHTHVAPGGTSQHLMVDITHGGFRPKTFEATVAGIVTAIERAHADIQPSDVTVAETTVADAGVNRSKTSWDRNPEEDKNALPNGVDTRSVTLHVSRGGKQVGLINWYSLHPTSFGAEYKHIAGDNKGYAAWATEEAHGVEHRYPEDAPFVAAFANMTPGDITPNMGLTPNSGPGADERESAQILGERMMAATNDLGKDWSAGGIDGRMRWVNCPQLVASPRFTPDKKEHKLGPAILGAAFAASSQEDGGGVPILGFNEGERGGNPWVRDLNNFLSPQEIKDIHGPKEGLLPMGYIDGMIQQVHPFTIHRLGSFVLVSLGFEPTVTSGLRIKRTVAAALNVPENTVVVQGYTNAYGHYITTPEEYEAQNYEGGATIFGQYQLPAFQDVFDEMARALKEGEPVEVGEPAGDLTGLIPNVPGSDNWMDAPPPGKKFGEVLEAPREVKAGSPARVVFVGANPNNDMRHGEGYVTIEDASGKVVADDSSENTLITFENSFGQTRTTVEWGTSDVQPGKYTVRLKGDWKAFLGKLSPFEGTAELQVS